MNLNVGLLTDAPFGRFERVQLEWNAFAMRLNDMIKLATNGITSRKVDARERLVDEQDARLEDRIRGGEIPSGANRDAKSPEISRRDAQWHLFRPAR